MDWIAYIYKNWVIKDGEKFEAKTMVFLLTCAFPNGKQP